MTDFIRCSNGIAWNQVQRAKWRRVLTLVKIKAVMVREKKRGAKIASSAQADFKRRKFKVSMVTSMPACCEPCCAGANWLLFSRDSVAHLTFPRLSRVVRHPVLAGRPHRQEVRKRDQYSVQGQVAAHAIATAARGGL